MDNDEAKLLQEVESGSHDALGALLIHHDHWLRRIASNWTSSTVVVDELIQELSVRAFRSQHTFRNRGTNSFIGWLASILRSAAIDFFRKERFRRRSESLIRNRFLENLTANMPEARQFAQRVEAIEVLGRAVDSLPGQQRNAIEAVHLRGLSRLEAAEQLGVSLSAVGALLYRGMKDLRESIRSLSDLMTV